MLLAFAYVAVAVLLFLPAWRAPAHTAIGSGGDVDLFIWFLGWTPHALSHGWSPFVSDAINVPAGINLMWQTAVAVPAIVLWPVTAAFGPVVSYNLLITAGAALSALLAALLARSLVHSWPAAAVAGLLYGFSPFVLAHALGHPNLTMLVFPPLVGLTLVRLVRGRWSARRAGVVLGVAGPVQLLISEEILASSVLAALVLLIVAYFVSRERLQQLWPQLLTTATVAVPVGLVLGAVPLAVQFFGPKRVHGQLNSRTDNVADLLGFVVPTRTQALAPHALTTVSNRFTGSLVEWGAYLGVPLVVLLVWFVWRRWDDTLVRLVAVFGGAMAVMSLGPLVHVAGHHLPLPTPMAVVSVLPVFSNMLSGRLVIFVFLAVALLLARFVDDRAVLQSMPARAAAVVIALGVLMPHLPVVTSPVPMPRFFTTAADLDRVPAGSVALVVPYPGPKDARAMAWQARADIRFSIVGGYILVDGADGKPTSAGDPTLVGRVLGALESGFPPERLPAGLLPRVRAELARLGVATILQGPMPHGRATGRWLSELAGHAPQLVDGVAVWQDLG